MESFQGRIDCFLTFNRMLGLGYPKGPLAMGDAVGPAKLLAVLGAMQDFYGDPRYRPSPWLKRRALLGLSLLTPES